MKTLYQVILIAALALCTFTSLAQPWNRNTFPGPGYSAHGYPAGAGWDHTERPLDLAVSPADPNLRAFIDNEWTAVFTEDGVNFKPLIMPHIGTPGSSVMSIEFSRHDPSAFYLLVAHSNWGYLTSETPPAGLWRSKDRGDSWEHIYKLPPGGYERQGNSANGRLILEDPARPNNIYLGTTSNGLVRSIDGGSQWTNVGSGFSDRRIKTLAAGTYGNNQSVIYAIAEKKMPVRVQGQGVPVSSQLPGNLTARWGFNNNLNDASGGGNNLSGSVAGWDQSAAENSHAANFNGSSPLAIQNMSYSTPFSRFTISSWVRTTNSSDQVIASFDRNEYWEFGTRGGAVVWSVPYQAESVPPAIDPETIGFTSAEGYQPGELADNINWTGNGGFLVDPTGSGSVSFGGGWRGVTMSEGFPEDDVYSVGMRFSFNRNTDQMEQFRRIFQTGLTTGETGTSLELRRLHPANNMYALFGVNPGTTNRFPGSGAFSETLLGFDNSEDSQSDELLMNLTVFRGATLNQWSAIYELWNLTKDALVMRKLTGPFDVPSGFAENELFLFLNSANTDEEAKVFNRQIHSIKYGSASAPEDGDPDALTVSEITGPRIDDGDWHHVVGVFNAGLQQLYVDGELVASANTGTATFGSGNTRYGYVGAGSQSSVFGDGKIRAGSGFHGSLDDVRIYNTNAFNQNNVYAAYLEFHGNNPIVQGQLWRIKIDSKGDVEEVRRLHAGAEDFFQIAVNPEDPSQGWFIRKGYPNGWPLGGRELVRFSNFGETIIPSNVALGGSSSFEWIGINPSAANHLFLALTGPFRHSLRYSMDGGSSWQGVNRQVGDVIPSYKSWTARNHYWPEYQFPHVDNPSMASKISFVPGVPNELLFVTPKKGGLLRSLDYGATFQSYATGGPNKDIGQIAVAPGNPGHWGIAKFEQGYSITKNNGKLWRGASYLDNPALETLISEAEAAGDWWTAARTAGGIAFHPANSDIVIGTWTRQGYIVRSTDGGLNWNYTGYRDKTLTNMDVYWKDPLLVYAGRMKSEDAGVTWTDINKTVISVSDSNSDIIIGVDNINVNVNAGSLGLYISVDAGENWVSLPAPPAESVPGLGNTKWQVTSFQTKWHCSADALIAIDPRPAHDPTVHSSNRLRLLMAGRSGIYEYNAPNQNGSGSASDWQVNDSGLEPSPHFNLIEPVPWMGFVLFDPRPGYEHVVYAAKQNDDAKLKLWAGEDNKNHSYPGGYNFEPFYMSLDGGITWEKMHGEKFPEAPQAAMIQSMIVDSDGRLLAATTQGIYMISVDGIANPPTYIKPENIQGNEQGNKIILYPNPSNGQISLKNAGDGELSIYSLTGQKIFMQPYQAGVSVNLTGISAGVYLLRLQGEDIFSKLLIIKE